LPTILEPFNMGDLRLRNHVVMGPMTRARALDSGEITPLAAEYYAQRSTAGLIISEGIYPTPEGKGYFATPGLVDSRHVAAWRDVTGKVHEKGGTIFAQIMHCGRVGHHLNNPGYALVSASAVQANASILTREQGMAQMSPPRALDTAEVETLLDGFEQSAVNAKAAGFDGVELHAASGYLPHQFLGSGTNLRTDKFGGTPQKRCRFVLDVIDRFTRVYGASRVGIKLAPKITYNDMVDEEADVTFDILVRALDRLGLAYLSFQTTLSYETLASANMHIGGRGKLNFADVFPYAFMRERFHGPLMAAGDLTFDIANQALEEGRAELFVFGRAYVSNPDLVARFAANAKLAEPSMMTLYGGGAPGYTDYPTMA
jgi:N-ethylmaleimide reductase